ncbi:MAG: hypothetical protein M1813_002126 [Trichoglossum hirsutum]|nr:MAG: hypothetical protein M1813_002126 [Trichoglossum hirsutum]
MPVTFNPAAHGASPIRISPSVKTSEELLSYSCPSEHKKCVEHLQSSFDDITPDSNIFSSPNGFVNAVIQAYSHHHHLVIRPDDVWIAILSQFSIYVNQHAEELRGQFVGHEGKKELVIKNFGDRYSVDFGQMTQRMGALLGKVVIDPELKGWVVNNFTTTTKTDMIVSSVIMMATLQAYFAFKFELSCGLPSVTLLGEKSDWESILLRIEKLLSFGDETAQWYQLLKPVLSRFVAAFDAPHSEANLEFWRNIAHHTGNGSGPSYYSGWITAFCFWEKDGKLLYSSPVQAPPASWYSVPDPRSNGPLTLDGVAYHFINTEDVPLGYASVPVKIDDNGHKLDSYMVAGSVGFKASKSSSGQRGVPGDDLDTIQPVVGWWIFESRSHEELDAEAKAPQGGWESIFEDLSRCQSLARRPGEL